LLGELEVVGLVMVVLWVEVRRALVEVEVRCWWRLGGGWKGKSLEDVSKNSNTVS
jgi:hypothetical protein